VDASLNARWDDDKTHVHFIPEYSDSPALIRWLEQQGIKQVPEGFYDDFAMTTTMMTVDPETVRSKERITAKKFRIIDVEFAPAAETIDLGQRIDDDQTEATIATLRRTLARPAR
jgi:hypothetical protein